MCHGVPCGVPHSARMAVCGTQHGPWYASWMVCLIVSAMVCLTVCLAVGAMVWHGVEHACSFWAHPTTHARTHAPTHPPTHPPMHPPTCRVRSILHMALALAAARQDVSSPFPFHPPGATTPHVVPREKQRERE